jgi:hypothetical protein
VGGAALLGLSLLWFASPAQANISFDVAALTKGAGVDGIYITENNPPDTGTSTFLVGIYAGNFKTAKQNGTGGSSPTASLTLTTGTSGSLPTHYATATGYISISSVSVSGNQLTLKATVDGYSFNIVAKSNQDASVSPGVPMGMTTFGATVSSLGAGTKARSFIYNMGDSKFNSPTGPPLFLSTTTFGNLGPGGANSVGTGNSVGSQAAWTVPGKADLTVNVQVLPPTHPKFKGSVATDSRSVPTGKGYGLADFGGGINMAGGAGNTTHFFSQAVTYTPEPSGIALACLGVPCVGGFVFLSLRRRTRTLPVAV